MQLGRRKPDAEPDRNPKPFRVTIHADGDQWHTFDMGPGDGVGVGAIRVDITSDGEIDVSPSHHADPNYRSQLRTPIEQ